MARLGQLQNHNHQDDDHQHSDDDADNSSVHFASLRLACRPALRSGLGYRPAQQSSRSVRPRLHESNLAEIGEPRGRSDAVPRCSRPSVAGGGPPTPVRWEIDGSPLATSEPKGTQLTRLPRLHGRPYRMGSLTRSSTTSESTSTDEPHSERDQEPSLSTAARYSACPRFAAGRSASVH